MIKGTKETLDKIVETHLCPEHGPKLAVAWHAQESSYVLRCGENHYPDEVTRAMTPTKEYKVGKRDATARGLDLMPKADLATGEVLTKEMVEALYLYAKRYGLDAYRGHVMLIYGKPYTGIDGYLYLAYKSGVEFQLRSRPLNEDERKGYRVGEEDHAWTCEIIIAGGQKSFTGLGIVTHEEMTAMSTKKPNQLRSPVVAAHPWQLAQKRAEWQALRRAFPIGEPDEETED